MSCLLSPRQNDVHDDAPEKTQTPATDVESAPFVVCYYPTEVPVTFFPSLNDTRRAWILEKLRQERANSVLDVGCGPGGLLSCLCNSAAFLKAEDNQDDPDGKHDGDLSYVTDSEDGLPELQISRIAGLDISQRALAKCILSTSPLLTDGQLCMPRWQRLEMKIWQGSLDVYNPEFKGIDCIVSSEVIEHLPPAVLSAFAPTLLGLYRPRILLITTPNYTFNARFTAPGVPNPGGFLDPTGRTDRVFRHHDHKFEWTSSEFKGWCEDAAASWGYTVDVEAVGTSMEQDPWGRDDELGGASQVALFRRNDDWQGQRPVPAQPSQEGAHKLLKTHVRAAHPRAGLPESYEKICELVTKYMESYYFDHGYSVWELWVENSISIACGGRLDVLLRAIEAFPALCLTRKDSAAAREWNVKFAGDKHREAVEATKKENREGSFPHEFQPNGLETEGAAVETPKWPDPAQEWYALAGASSAKDEKLEMSNDDDWWANKSWSVGWEEAKTADVCG